MDDVREERGGREEAEEARRVREKRGRGRGRDATVGGVEVMWVKEEEDARRSVNSEGGGEGGGEVQMTSKRSERRRMRERDQREGGAKGGV